MSSQAVASPGEPDPVQRFFRYFQLEATALQEQMARLENVPTIGGERLDAIDHCLAGISRLQKEVHDAASYTTAYDQRMYSEGVKALYEKLEETRTALAPKSKFSFKSPIKKNSSAISLTDAAELAMQQRASLVSPHSKDSSSGAPSAATTPSESATPPTNDKGLAARPETLRRGSLGSFLKAAGVESNEIESRKKPGQAIRKMSFASSNSVHISSHSSVHIILPSSASHATSSGSLVNLRHCIVDMSTPTTSGQPFAALTIKDVKQSLLICGDVSGAAHITNVQSSVILVATNQFRMHSCQNCIVYLHVNSRPVVEDCREISFAPLRRGHSKSDTSAQNQWNMVQDFNWPKASPSPNWKALPAEETVKAETWSTIKEGGPEWSLDGILKVTGVFSLIAKAQEKV